MVFDTKFSAHVRSDATQNLSYLYNKHHSRLCRKADNAGL